MVAIIRSTAAISAGTRSSKPRGRRASISEFLSAIQRDSQTCAVPNGNGNCRQEVLVFMVLAGVCVLRATKRWVRQAAADCACMANSARLSGARLNANHEGVAHEQATLRLYPWHRLRWDHLGNEPSLRALFWPLRPASSPN